LLEGCDVVVASSAIGEENPELLAARAARIPVIARAEMLGELMRYRHGIAIAGTHGKTTTTSLVTAIFQAAALDPTFVIGGLLNSAGTNAKLGASRFIVVEADESDASFLHLQPMLAVITNVDMDHMSTYDHDFQALRDTFVRFAHRLPFYGSAVVCIDDANLCELLGEISRPLITYGFAESADYRAVNLNTDGRRWRFTVQRPAGHVDLQVQMSLPGEHNVRNALAAIAVATDEGLPDTAIVRGLRDFRGVGRRFEVTDSIAVGDATATLVDDYGHHPTEVAAVIATARRVWPDRRLVMAYQPHRYSRTRDLFDDFVRVLSDVDELLLLDVYAAGEQAVAGADGKALCQGIRQRGSLGPVFAQDCAEAETSLPSIVRDGDVVIVQGAGNVSALSQALQHPVQPVGARDD